jgi:hypothetical protein
VTHLERDGTRPSRTTTPYVGHAAVTLDMCACACARALLVTIAIFLGVLL